MKKVFVFLILGLFLISLTSAFEIDNTMDYDEETNIITFENRWGIDWLGGGVVAEAHLIENICEENRFCHATKEITLNEEMALIEDFRTLRVDDDSWEEQNIRSHKFEYWGDIKEYETQCSDDFISENETIIHTCNKILIGFYKGWIEFKAGDIFKEGEYLVRTSGEIKPGRVYDWQIKINSDWTTPWEIWGEIGIGGATAEITLNSPVDNFITLIPEVEFNCSANITGGATLTNMSLFTNETGNWERFNSTLPNGTIFEEATGFIMNEAEVGSGKSGLKLTANSNVQIINLTKASSSAATLAYVLDSSLATLATATFIGDVATFSSPVALTSGIDYYFAADKGGSSFDARRVSSGYPSVKAKWTYIDGLRGGASDPTRSMTFESVGYTASDVSTAQTIVNNRTITDDIIWNCEACDSDSDCGFATQNRTVLLDKTKPQINIENPNGTLNYGTIGRNETLNVTFTDTNLDACWFDYNGTNVTIDGCQTGVKNSTIFSLELNNLNMTIYANDSLGNLNSTFIEWDYKIFQNSFIFDNETRAGDQEDFTLNITLKSGLALTSATFIWNGFEASPSIFSDGQQRIITVENYAIALLQSDTNISIFFNLILDDLSEINTTNETQLVNAIFLDDCSAHANQLFNISLFDEALKTPLLGDIEFNYKLLNVPGFNEVNSLNLSFTNENNIGICSDINLTDENFVQSIEIRYSSDGYTSELYHIQRGEITSNTIKLNLFDLNVSDSTEFKLTYQDSTFNFVEGAIIQLQRKYISEDTYEVVEAPLTSSDGVSIVHIDLDTNKYKITVVKNGVILDTFNNIVFDCQSELTGDCEQKLLGKIDPRNDEDFDTTRDFSHSEPVRSGNTVTLAYSIPSGTPSAVNIQLLQKDQFGTSTLCNKTITSSAGSIQCEFLDTIGDSYLDYRVYKNGEPMIYTSYLIPESSDLDFLGNNYIIILVLLFSIVGMALTSPEWIIINSIVTMVIAGALYLANGVDFLVGLGNLMWLIIAAGIIIFKLAKQEDR